jgi:vacuolar protein sorting-associated protein 35
MQPQIGTGSITQYATPPPQQQQQQQIQTQSQANSYASQPATTGSYAARSAMAHGSTAGSVAGSTFTATPSTQATHPASTRPHGDTPADQAHQNRILTDATRKVQEHAYYMKQAMDRDDLPTVLDRASHMVGELGDRHSLSPKNYYELHMRALDDMPNLEEYFLGIQPVRFVYDSSQYCPKVLPRLYLQICAASALIRSGEEKNVTVVLNDLTQAVKCVQNPVRGLFLRHYLLQALRDKLPDEKDPEKGTVEDAYNFVMSNFIEMNKLWVRLQHLPGDGKSKEQRKKRERERNELRILVGTNLVRLSQMEGVTSQIYGQVILPKVLEQIVACGDPLAQAYLIDCIIQVFPDEYHIETLSILLAVCPKLKDKVNIRTILQSLMDRLANYYSDEELLDETDTNEVKKSLAMDSFTMFEACVQNVYNARGPKLTTKEVIRLQTALLNFSLKCYPGHMEHVNQCLGVCVTALRQASNAIPAEGTVAQVQTAPKLDEASITELEKLLSIPLDTLALKVLQLEHYGDLLGCLPWENRRDVGMTMLRAIVSSGGSPPKSVKELEELFGIIAPVFREEHAVPPKEHTAREVDLLKGLGVVTAAESFGPIAEDAPVDAERASERQEGCNLVSKLVHMLDHEDTDVAFQMLCVARSHLSMGGKSRVGYTLVPVVFSALQLVNRIYDEEYPPPKPQEEEKTDEAVVSEPQKEEETKEEGESPGIKDEENPESAGDGEAQEEEGVASSTTEKEDTGDAPKVETAVDDPGEEEVHVDIDTKESAVVDPPASDVSHHEPQKENRAELSRKKTIR